MLIDCSVFILVRSLVVVWRCGIYEVAGWFLRVFFSSFFCWWYCLLFCIFCYWWFFLFFVSVYFLHLFVNSSVDVSFVFNFHFILIQNLVWLVSWLPATSLLLTTLVISTCSIKKKNEIRTNVEMKSFQSFRVEHSITWTVKWNQNGNILGTGRIP